MELEYSTYASVLDMISIQAASFYIQRQASIDTDGMSALGQKAGKRRLCFFIEDIEPFAFSVLGIVLQI